MKNILSIACCLLIASGLSCVQQSDSAPQQSSTAEAQAVVDPSAMITKNLRFDSFQFSPGGRYLVTHGHSTSVLWDAKTGNMIRALKKAGVWPDRGDVTDLVAFSSDDLRVAVARQSSIDVEDVLTGAKTCTLSLRRAVYPPALAFSHDGRFIVGSGSHLLSEGSSDLLLDVWDASTGERIWDPTRELPFTKSDLEKQMALLPADVLSDPHDYHAKFYVDDLKLLLLLKTVRGDGKRLIVDRTLQIDSLPHFSPCGRWLVSRTSIMPLSEYTSPAVLWDAQNVLLKQSSMEDDVLLRPFLFSADGNRLFRKSAASRQRVAFLAAPTPIADDSSKLPKGSCLALSPDGKLAVLCDVHLSVYEVQSGKLLMKLDLPGNSTVAAQFSPDQNRLLVRFDSDLGAPGVTKALLYDVADGFRELVRLDSIERLHSRYNGSLGFNATGERLFVFDALWDAKTGTKIRQFNDPAEIPDNPITFDEALRKVQVQSR